MWFVIYEFEKPIRLKFNTLTSSIINSGNERDGRKFVLVGGGFKYNVEDRGTVEKKVEIYNVLTGIWDESEFF